MKRERGEQGSVLVDALVAIGVMAVALTAAAQVMSDASRRMAAAEESRLALMEARSRLAEVGGDIPLQVGVVSGDDEGLFWRVEIEPAPGLSNQAGRLLDVTVNVADARGRGHAALSSRRFAGV